MVELTQRNNPDKLHSISTSTLLRLLENIKPVVLDNNSSYFDIGVEYSKSRIRDALAKDLGLTTSPISEVQQLINRVNRG